jgi:HAD superfamily hydrolase (TIGR01509 family)
MDKKIHGCPARQSIYALFTHLSTEQKEEVLEQCEDFETSLRYEAVDGVKELLSRLKENYIPTALVTSSLPPKVIKVFTQLQLDKMFDTVVTSNLVEKGKPDPACYLMAAQRLNKQPQKCIVFEDAVSGIKSATAAGMFVIGIGNTAQESLLKEVGAEEVIADFEQVQLEKQGNVFQLQINENLSLQLSTSQFITK